MKNINKFSLFLILALVFMGSFANYQIAQAVTGEGTATIAVDGIATSSAVTVVKGTSHKFTIVLMVGASGITANAENPTFTIPTGFTVPDINPVADAGSVVTDGNWSVIGGGTCLVNSSSGGLTAASGTVITVDVMTACTVDPAEGKIILTYKGTSAVAMGATPLNIGVNDVSSAHPVTSLTGGSPTITVNGALPYIPFNGHNLYISPVDNSTGILWDSTCTGDGTSCKVTDATSTIGGAANTATIVSVLGAGNYAAQVCSNLNYDGYSDWYLPAFDQLSAMYTASSTVNKGDYLTTWVNFTSGYYWSSTEYTYMYAVARDFSSGVPVGAFKGLNLYGVRCVRSGPTSNIANTDLVLGLVGTSAGTSNDAVATAAISGDGTTVDITSVGVGSATITVTAANGNQMTIAVIVAADGTFTSVTPTKWSATIAHVTNNALNFGLVGTSVVSSNTSVATVAISGDGTTVDITSVGVGTATITVTAANGNQAIINSVSVAANGSFSYGPVKWTAKTNSNTTNTTLVLGLVGTTAISSNTAIATTLISGGNIVITSVGVGTVTITVSDGTNSATIPVTVDATGAITLGTIVPFTPVTSSRRRRVVTDYSTTTLTGTESLLTIIENGSTSSIIIATSTILVTPIAIATTTSSVNAKITENIPYQFSFTRVLKLGSVGDEVRQLQIFLNKHGFSLGKTGNGSAGKETTYFGQRTKDSLIKFQEVNAKDILIPQGLIKGTGIFLNYSKKFINQILLSGN